MARVRRVHAGIALVLALTAAACGGDDGPTGPAQEVQIPFTSQQSACAGVFPGILTVTALYGPSGATVNNVIPGTYRVTGTYDLTGSGVTTGTISLGFLGSVVTGQGGQQAASQPFTVPVGSLTGNFQAIQGFLQLTAGSGRPVVDFVVGSSAYDCVSLH